MSSVVCDRNSEVFVKAVFSTKRQMTSNETKTCCKLERKLMSNPFWVLTFCCFNLADATQVFIIDGEHLLHLHTKQLQLPCLGKKKRYKSRSTEHYRALLSMPCGVHPCCSGFFPMCFSNWIPFISGPVCWFCISGQVGLQWGQRQRSTRCRGQLLGDGVLSFVW